ncbi:hypothetical protein GGI1_03891, partial [Acidithiobacillus sp. GGI-221]
STNHRSQRVEVNVIFNDPEEPIFFDSPTTVFDVIS